MAGIYIHIPFCKSRCIYCAFYSTTAASERQRYVDALCHEMALRGTKNAETIETIYLGGGTPSQLSPEQLQQIFTSLYNIYKVSPKAEITIECNPDDVTNEYATTLSQLGINRVSMGAQTFDDQRLQFLHRRHSAAQVRTAVERLRQAGIDNISVDLMYGFPNETLDDWQHDIDAVLSLDVEHISAYCLMIEEGTVLYEQMRNEKQEMSSEEWEMRNEGAEELEQKMYETLIDSLTAAGYEHYEISNFARPGRRSRHNSSYWTDVPYIGLGAAAHSYDGHRRRWNVSDLWKYMKGIEDEAPAFEEEVIDGDTRYNDRLTVALRTCEGISLDELSEQHRDYLLRSASRYMDDGLLIYADDHLRLSRKGLFVSDMVLADLMIVDD